MGLASKEEILELERLMIQYPEIKQAVTETEDALLGYVQLNAEEAPAGTKEKIRNALFPEPVGPQRDIDPVKALHGKSKGSGKARLWAYISIAASLLFVISIGYHFISIASYKKKIAALQQQNLELAAQNKTFMAQIQRANESFQTLANPDLKSILLSGVAGHEANQALVYWNHTTNEVYLMLTALPKLPPGKQYQLWAIVDGKPISAGLYDDQSEQGLQKMVSIGDAEMFAITIENEGGSKEPSMDQMVVAGKV